MKCSKFCHSLIKTQSVALFAGSSPHRDRALSKTARQVKARLDLKQSSRTSALAFIRLGREELGTLQNKKSNFENPKPVRRPVSIHKHFPGRKV